MDIPTAADIRERSDVVFAEYNYPEPAGADPDRLQYKVDDSAAELAMLLASQGMSLDWASVDDDPPTNMSVLLSLALKMLVEYNVARGQQEILDTISDFDLLSTWSAGPVSENRRNISANATVLHPHPTLNRLLLGIVALNNGTLGLNVNVPVVGAVDAMRPKPGSAYMEKQNLFLSIFGDIPGAPFVYRVY